MNRRTESRWPDGDRLASRVPGSVPCPECSLPAEIAGHFWLDSTDGPVEHLALACLDGHCFRLALDRLAIDVQAEVRALRDSAWPAADEPETSAGGAGFSRLPGCLGTVGNPPDAVARLT
ncbi:MAG TPA: hypothetical protein VGI58_16625 [Streptosporangiaceae bacterium]|jgi:hypothetical protein